MCQTTEHSKSLLTAIARIECPHFQIQIPVTEFLWNVTYLCVSVCPCKQQKENESTHGIWPIRKLFGQNIAIFVALKLFYSLCSLNISTCGLITVCNFNIPLFGWYSWAVSSVHYIESTGNTNFVKDPKGHKGVLNWVVLPKSCEEI